VPITASGKQLLLPARGSGISGSTCSGEFAVTPLGISVTATQVITSVPYPGAPCTLNSLTGAITTAGGNQLIFAASGSSFATYSCTGNFVVTFSGATVKVTSTTTSSYPYPGAPCNIHGLTVPITASGNELYIPTSGSGIAGSSCSGYYTVSLW